MVAGQNEEPMKPTTKFLHIHMDGSLILKDPQALEQLWAQSKPTRQDFLKDDSELLELLHVHDQQCSPEELDRTIKQYWKSGDPSALDPILDMLSRDMMIRTFFAEKMGRDEEELDFLLGRPLATVIEFYNMKVEKDEEGTYHLIQG